MSVTALEKLMFTVGMHDAISAPANSINRTITGMKDNATDGFNNIKSGAIGLVASGMAIKTFMEPVYEFKQALGEVKSLEVAQKELDTLTKGSLAFSIQYGESAADFVRSSYDIQSSISGLANGELNTFTMASNVLAKGTKSDAATITNYMGTMYGIFKDSANNMGKSKWVEQLTGQTATAVQMFKTDGTQMAAAFTSVGANATASGISLHEQMAIMGTLQSTMSGSESGTKYKAFLRGVAGAQDKLGLSFTDSKGRMLPMVSILNTLKGKFGDTLSEVEGLELKKAFGSSEAVSAIKLLMSQTDELSGSINALGNVTGMDKANKMALTMVDPWEQFGAATEAVRIGFGTALMPTINEFLGVLIGGLATLTSWTTEFPNLTRWVGLLTIGVLGLALGTSLFTLMMGISKLAMAGWGIAALAFKGILIGLNFALGLFRLGVLLLNMAMYLNPVGVMIAGFLALGAVVIGLLVYWDDLYQAFADTSFGAGILDFIDKAIGGFKQFMQWVGVFDSDVEAKVTQMVSTEQIGAFQAPEVEQISSLKVMRTPFNQEKSITENLALALKSGAGGMSFGDVHISAENGMGPEALEQWGALQGG
jgi:TP901 family phage tail tape measure protein